MNLKVGFHVSIAGGIANSVNNAKKLGCSAFQIFTRNPRGWAAKPLQQSEVSSFKNRLAISGIEKRSVVVHMPYLPNLSGPPGESYQRSVKALTEEIQRCDLLGISYLVIHLGSHMGRGPNSGIDQLVNALQTAIARGQPGNELVVLLENNAGYRNSVGGTLEELRLILDRLDGRSTQFGICIDTCHLFASGYDLRTRDDVSITFEKIKNIVGLETLKMIHLNDAKGALGSNLDRHEHIGLGSIGIEGFTAFLSHGTIHALPIIMETPIDTRRGDQQNLKVVLEILKKQE
ncbi:MAG: deoxyribonuclease IV [Thermoproteota archaeon]|nr:deoxyribonuclease IV [Thermoproteota archaeon]